ncbi:hypothetical protein EW026_g4788 [Hermanssonia centrifuga]|uniref:Uncharacterized protein n=1 Tax=Hermanssonia centrifuga TaxID=98765 RepID=A0A4S4KGC9_9APHY|nr:hypothetical protein EW026_g4788 [Hermanssonia centrifuga]
MPMFRKSSIDAEYTDDNVMPKILNGVKMGEGDGTVSLLSLGAMCVEGWKRKRWNPAGMKVVTVEIGMAPKAPSLSMEYLDGLVGASSPENRYMITSPNVEFVPLPIWGTIKLRMRADGRFGIHDPVNCPQMFLYKHGHLAALLRKPDDLHDPITWKHSADKPAPLKANRMGAFSTEPTVVQKLLAIGLPVWFVRRSDQLPSTVVIKRMVTAANTAVIEMGLGPFPTEPIYHGLAGTEQHFSVLWRSTSHMLDIEHVLISDGFVEEAEGVVRSTHSHTNDCPYNRNLLSKSRTAKPPKIRGMDKFVIIEHVRVPQPVKTWSTALANVNRAITPANNWGYWLPEPHILVGPEGTDRARNCLRNWFWVREGWYYMLAHRALRFDPLPSKLWRDWLQHEPEKVKEYTKDTALTRRRTYVFNLFKEYFPEELRQLPSKDTIFWDNRRVVLPPSNATCRQIAWEVLEIAFRVELLELDRYLVPIDSNDNTGTELFRQEKIARIFPDAQPMRPVRLPTSCRGLAASHIEDRRDSLHALYEVVRRWPEVPPAIRDSGGVRNLNVARLESLERALATYYVQKFYEVSGRAATIPYHFPLSTPYD